MALSGDFTSYNGPGLWRSLLCALSGVSSNHPVVVLPLGPIRREFPPLDDTRERLTQDGKYYLREVLGPPMFLDVAKDGSNAHRPWWIWTNIVHYSTFAMALSNVVRPPGHWVEDFFDSNVSSIPVVKDGVLLCWWTRGHGIPCATFSTFVAFLGSYVVQN